MFGHGATHRIRHSGCWRRQLVTFDDVTVVEHLRTAVPRRDLADPDVLGQPGTASISVERSDTSGLKVIRAALCTRRTGVREERRAPGRSAVSLHPCQPRMRRRHARGGDAERRAGDVIESQLLAEGDGVGVAAVLATDADAQGWTYGTALVDGKLHEPSDPVSIEGLEGIARQDLLLHVAQEELA